MNTPKDYRDYCDHVGRVNALLREADPALDVLLYYPICDLWAEYRPVAEPLQIESLAALSPVGGIQPASAEVIVGSFVRDGRYILVLVNVSDQPYEGSIRLSADWWSADPASGKIDHARPDRNGWCPRTLPPIRPRYCIEPCQL